LTKTSFSHGQLQALVDRIERLEEEKKTIAADIKEVYAEAKGNGFDVKILRKVVSLRKKEAAEREEEQAMLDVYLTALGMQTHLFDDEIPETQSQTEVASEAVIEGNGESTPNANATDANKTPSTHREVELPPAPPPEPILECIIKDAAEPEELSRDGLESFAADIGDIPEFLRRVA
jgi:uncharacterized protein (UPF0335 family)